MFSELDIVALTRDVREYGLRRGDIGTVVFVYPPGTELEVEFVTDDGVTRAVLTLPGTDLRYVPEDELPLTPSAPRSGRRSRPGNDPPP